MTTTLDALVTLLIRKRLATPDTVWRMTFREATQALRALAGPSALGSPTQSDLAALMRAFPDMTEPEEPDHG
ncbi:MAG: phage tail assembly chaperone [Pseudomonadota bacterium]